MMLGRLGQSMKWLFFLIVSALFEYPLMIWIGVISLFWRKYLTWEILFSLYFGFLSSLYNLWKLVTAFYVVKNFRMYYLILSWKEHYKTIPTGAGTNGTICETMPFWFLALWLPENYSRGNIIIAAAFCLFGLNCYFLMNECSNIFYILLSSQSSANDPWNSSRKWEDRGKNSTNPWRTTV